MDPLERYRLVQELFLDAVDLGPAARAALLERRCGDPDGDALGLRREVEALLAADLQAEVFLEGPLTWVPSGESPADPDETAAAGKLTGRSPAGSGQRVGPYRLLRVLGRGGMSTVYLAVQEEEGYHRRVALKIIRQGMEGQDSLRRLRTEQQILAALDHPGIARLLHGGATGEGVPYFVLEYVDGVRIDAWCDQRRLPISDRLRLFLKVCDAVQYAHQNLVVHRDVKPGNILVTEAGIPKLLDFGIAKLLNPELAQPEIAPTVSWLRLMTPYYASPEQVRGQPLNTTTDVYSLGVLLYELLTGCLPYRFGSRTPQEVEQAVVEHEPERPSNAVLQSTELAAGSPSPEEIGRRRGLRPEQLRRRLRGDLDNVLLRALRKEPQRRYPSVERLAEDVRRHLAGLPVAARKDTFDYRLGKFVRRNRWGVAVASIFLLLVAAFVTFVQRQAQQIRRQADEIVIQRDQANLAAARQRLLLEFVNRLFREASNRGESRGQALTARELLDLGPELVTEAAAGLEEQAELLHGLALIYLDFGVFDRAEKLLRQALALRRETLDEHHPDVAKTLFHLAETLAVSGRYGDAEPFSQEALAMRQEAGESGEDLLRSLDQLAFILYSRTDYARSEPLYRQALEVRRRLYGEQDARYAQGLNLLALNHMAAGRNAEAAPLLDKALRIQRRNLGDSSHEVAYALNNLAALHYFEGDLDAAEPKFEEALAIWRRILQPHDRQLGHPLQGLGRIYLDRGQPKRAEPVLRESLTLWRDFLPPSHWRLAQAEGLLGLCLVRLGQFEEAEELLTRGYPRLLEERGAEHRDTRLARTGLVELYEATGRPALAAEYRQGPEG